MNREEKAKKIQKMIAKAWADEAFKQKLLSNPSKTIREEGIEPPPGVEVRVMESTDKVYYFVLPPKPQGDEITEMPAREAATVYCSSCFCY